MRFLIDKEIDLTKEDLLNTKNYSNTLKDIILNSPKESPFTIGLFGEWGSGKSSIIKTVKDNLEENGIEKIKFIVYDAWKYANDSFRRMFLFRIQEELKFDRSEYFNSFYTNKTTDVKIVKKFHWPFFIITVIIALVTLVSVQSLRDVDSKILAAATATFAAIFVNIFGRAFVDHKITVQEPMFFSPEQFEEAFDEMVSSSLRSKTIPQTIYKFVTGLNYISGLQKIVIVVDNIDRCSKDLAYEMLTNLKNFLKDKKNLIFVVPVDDGALRRHIMKGGEESGKEAEEFLRKFFNVVLRIKPFQRYDLYDFTCRLNDKEDVGFNPTTLDIISKEYASNPRRIIQFINNLTAELKMFSYYKGADFIRRNESLICKLLILREEWPEYYFTISKNPEILSKPYPENTPDALKSFLSLTHSVNLNSSYEDIESVFLIQLQDERFPLEVKEGINQKDISKLQQAIENNVITRRDLIDGLLRNIHTGKNRGLYQTEVNNMVETLSLIDEKIQLQSEEHRRLFEEIKSVLSEIAPNIIDLDAFCRFGLKAKSLGYPYVHNYIQELIKRAILGDQNPNEYTLAKKFLIAVIGNYGDQDLDFQKTTLKIDYEKSKDPIRNYGLSKESLKKIITDDFLLEIINKISDFSNNSKSYTDLLFVSEFISFRDLIINQICIKYNEIYPSLNNIEKVNLISIIIEFNRLFQNKETFFENPDKIDPLFTWFTKWTGKRTIGGQVRPVFQEFSELDQQALLLDFCIIVYRLSKGSIDVNAALLELTKKGISKEVIFEKLVLQIDPDHQSLTAIRDLLINDDTFSDAHLTLLGYLFLVKFQGNSLGTDILKERLSKIIRAMIDSKSEVIQRFLLDWLKDDRVKSTVEDIVGNLGKDDILRLPAILLQFTFDKITQGDQLFQFEANLGVLQSIASKGNNEHRKKLLKVINVKLLKEDGVEEALEILEEFPHLTKEQIATIRGDINKILNDQLKEEAREILNNKSSDIRKKDGALYILKAIYSSDRNGVSRNVTRKVRSLVNNNNLDITITNENLVEGEDPDGGHIKDFYLQYIINNEIKDLHIKEHETLKIPEKD